MLNQAVKRNSSRFPEDFMFQLNPEEIQNLISQNVIPNKGLLDGVVPFAFTQEGVAMLSGLLRSEKAIAINIAIMRAFVAMRQHTLNYEALAAALVQLENNTNQRFREINQVLDALLKQKKAQEDVEQRRRIGFK